MFLILKPLLALHAPSPPRHVCGIFSQRLNRHGQKTSDKYNPARLLSVIPSHFLEEHALLLSSLGRHEEVLHIYVRQVRVQIPLASGEY